MARKKSKHVSLERNIAAVFYRFRREVKSIKYAHLDSAVRQCFGHVESNRYEATFAEVVDLVTAEVYLSVYITVEGNIFTFFGEGAKKKLKEIRQTLQPRLGEALE